MNENTTVLEGFTRIVEAGTAAVGVVDDEGSLVGNLSASDVILLLSEHGNEEPFNKWGQSIRDFLRLGDVSIFCLFEFFLKVLFSSCHNNSSGLYFYLFSL